MVIGDTRSLSDSRIANLVESLESEPELEIFDRRMQYSPGMGIRLSLVDLANWLIRRATRMGADEAIDNLRQYLGSQEIPFHAIFAIRGVLLTESYDFGSNIQLVPWAQVPDSRMKEAFGQDLSDAALLRLDSFPRLHVLPEESEKFKPPSIDYSEMGDALLCLGIAGPSAVQNLARWHSPVEWAPVFGQGYSAHYHPFPPRSQSGPEAICKAQQLFKVFSGLDASRKDALRLPMERLNSAMDKPPGVDAAIDLGISLESIFLRDMNKERGELGYRLRVRAARLLGKNPTERVELSKVFRALYEARSRAVHTGHLPTKIRSEPLHELLDRGYRLTADAISRIILEGEPDWELLTFS